MIRIKVTKPFKFSPDGVTVVDYAEGTHDVTERCAEIAITEKWARKVAVPKPKELDLDPGAPSASPEPE